MNGHVPGTLIARALRHSWRETVPALDLDAEQLAEVVPLLLGSGVGPLAWRRARASKLQGTRAERLLDEYRTVALRAAVGEHDVAEAVRVLRAGGVESILIKGWAVARLYPPPAVRPLGDIDLLVAPERREAARCLLDATPNLQVDLEQNDLATLRDRDWNAVFTRSHAVQLDDTYIRVPGLEDHLALLCMHFLRHGGWRPLWLCDIAAAVEARSPEFNWSVCLGDDERAADWIACALGLAHQILGADLDDTPVAWRAAHLPSWLVPAVLKQWETPTLADHPLAEESVLMGLRHPLRLPSILRQRWWDPIRVTVWANARFDERSRVPLQMRNYGWQARAFTSKIMSSRQNQS